MSLITSRFQYSNLSRIDGENLRLYQCPDGSRVPSVTTILSKTKPLESIQALQAWRDRIGHDAAQEITTQSANRGTRMHKYLENYLDNGFMQAPGSNPHSALGVSMASVIVEHGLCNVDEFWGSEVSLYYPELYAGTTDAVGIHKGQEAIIDFKQSNKPKKL